MSLNTENLRLLVDYVRDIKTQVEHIVSQQSPDNNNLLSIAPRIANADRILQGIRANVVSGGALEANDLDIALASIREGAEIQEFANTLSGTALEIDRDKYANLKLSVPPQGSVGLQTAMRAAVTAKQSVFM